MHSLHCPKCQFATFNQLVLCLVQCFSWSVRHKVPRAAFSLPWYTVADRGCGSPTNKMLWHLPTLAAATTLLVEGHVKGGRV